MLPATSTVTAFAIVLTLNFVRIKGQNCDALGINYYERLGCQPKFLNGANCPNVYTCPEPDFSKDYCTFQNNRYESNDNIYGTHYCNSFCYCDVAKGELNPITCAQVDCYHYPENQGKNCYNAYKPAGCCPVDQICEPFDDIHTCELNGKTYKEGQLMDTGDTCWLCECAKGFRGVFEAPFCMKQPCDLEIHYSVQIAKKCAPIYNPGGNEALCCPWKFLCPENIIQLTMNKIKRPNLGLQKHKCRFMDKKLSVGDSFVATYNEYNIQKNITCTCLLPPQVACIE